MTPTPEQIGAAFNRLRDAKYVGSDQNAQDIVTLLDAYESLRATKRCPKCGYDGPMPFHSCVVKDHADEVQKCFDDAVQLFCDGGFRYDTLQQFANSLLKAAGVKERVK